MTAEPHEHASVRLGWTIPRVEPTDDPDWYRTIRPCTESCHHPVHAFGHPERLHHLIEADLVRLAERHDGFEDD